VSNEAREPFTKQPPGGGPFAARLCRSSVTDPGGYAPSSLRVFRQNCSPRHMPKISDVVFNGRNPFPVCPGYFFARVAQFIERDASNIGDDGESPSASAIISGCMSAADGLAWNEEDGSAILSTLTISGRQADISWLHLSRKQDRHCRGRSITDAFRQHQPKERKRYETSYALSKPVALSQELQTGAHDPHPAVAGAKVEIRIPAARSGTETGNANRPVAQKQSTRLISGRMRSVTARDDQPSPGVGLVYTL
jgi:hypothetical protein